MKLHAHLFSLSLLCPLFCASLASHAIDLYLGERQSSAPYLSGDTFRTICDHIYDIKDHSLKPDDVHTGDVVFVTSNPDYLPKFFNEVHPYITHQYILVTHNSDENISEKYLPYIEDEKIFCWFAQNVAYIHPKLIPMPIGLENRLWGRNYDRLIMALIQKGATQQEKKHLVFLNFNANTNRVERLPAFNYFSQKKFCYCAPNQAVPPYLADICSSKFLVSPHGNGLDCHRTWEALYLGVIPIVKKSTLDAMYQDLPVLIVNDWSEVTEELLNTTYERMQNTSFAFEKLYIDYWKELFKQTKEQCKNQK